MGGYVGQAAYVWALIHVIQSDAATGSKVLWVVLILVVPLVGFLLWLVLGPRKV